MLAHRSPSLALCRLFALYPLTLFPYYTDSPIDRTVAGRRGSRSSLTRHHGDMRFATKCFRVSGMLMSVRRLCQAICGSPPPPKRDGDAIEENTRKLAKNAIKNSHHHDNSGKAEVIAAACGMSMTKPDGFWGARGEQPMSFYLSPSPRQMSRCSDRSSYDDGA